MKESNSSAKAFSRCGMGLWVSLALLSFYLLGLIQELEASPLKLEDFSIIRTSDGHVISLRQPIADVKKQLGDPIRIVVERKEPASDSPWDVLALKYDRLEISYLRNWPMVRFIRLQSQDFKTRRGVKVNDSEEEVVRKYGPPQEKSDVDIYSLDVPSKDSPTGIETYAIGFVFKDGKVGAILINVTSD